MTSFATQMTPCLDFSKAAEIDYFRELFKLYTQNPCLFKSGVPFWGENPLQGACMNDRLQFSKEAIERNDIHVAEIRGREEYEGNTVLQITTSQILDLLPTTNNSTNCLLMRYDSLNDKRDSTTLKVYYEGRTSENCNGQSFSYQSRETESQKIPVKVANVLLMVLIMAITFFLAASSNPPDPFRHENSHESASRSVTVWDMVIGHSQYQVIFYYMIFSMAGFFISMGALIYLLWPLPLRNVVNFVFIILATNYVLLVNMSMPQFSIIIGSSCISSGMFMGLSAATFIFCGLTASVLMKLFNCFRQIHQGAVCGELMA